ncbi:MAG: hypothetical protein CMD33_05140 [Flavobacteriales bacterium]|nr:hypothetical protein [Flavobacteriales bacterium]
MSSAVRTWLFCAAVYAVIGLSACSGTQKWADPPDWVLQRPTRSSHYIGVSSASKVQFGADADATAKKRALADMAGQIRVIIESTSVLHTTQFKGVAGQNFSERISSTSAEDLEEYELVATHEDATDNWAYYRLSKATYERIRNERKMATLEVASSHWTSAENARVEGRVAAALDFYIRGLETLQDYWGELNEWSTPGGTLALDRACLDGISQVLADLSLQPATSNLRLSFSDRYQGTLACKVLFAGAPAAQIPVWSRYNRGTLPKTASLSTNNQGICTFDIGQFDPGTKSAEMRLEIRMNDLSPRLKDSPVQQWIQSLPTPSVTVPIALETPTVHLRTKERINGKPSASSQLKNAIAQGLNTRGIQWVERAADADMVLELEADTREAGSASGFFTAMLNASAVLKNSEGQPILRQNLTDVKGVQLDWPKAHDAAYRKAQDEIEDTFIKKLIEALYQ